MATKKSTENLQLSVTRITRTIYFFIALYMLSIVVFDSGNLITRESIIDRWAIVSILLIINTFVWFIAVQKIPLSSKALIVYILTITLLVFAGLNTYWERGMASTTTIFYILPILAIATLKNRHALIATAVLCVGTYAFASVKYFNDFFNEGYRVQLWGSILIIGAAILTATWLVMIIAGLRHDSK
jgi:hypothetical protein